MHHLLAGTPIRLTFLQDRRALKKIDWVAVFDDLADTGAPLSRWRWCDLDAMTHVVLATDRETERHAGVLGLAARGVKPDAWLVVETALARGHEADPPLTRAMLAHALVRIACLDGKPVAFVANNRDRGALVELGDAIGGTRLHPPAEGDVVAFETAKLAREVGVGKNVLDLRGVSEAALLRDLRGLHGIRPERGKSREYDGATTTPARSGGATRRPRRATRTGRTG